MCSSASASSGPTCTNCDDEQHATHPSHGTPVLVPSLIASSSTDSQAENSPAGRRTRSFMTRSRLRGTMPGMTYETLLVDERDGITTITVNRPDALNALNATVLGELDAVTTAIAGA